MIFGGIYDFELLCDALEALWGMGFK